MRDKVQGCFNLVLARHFFPQRVDSVDIDSGGMISKVLRDALHSYGAEGGENCVDTVGCLNYKKNKHGEVGNFLLFNGSYMQLYTIHRKGCLVHQKLCRL